MIPRPRRPDDSGERPQWAAGPAGIVRRAFAHTSSPERELQRVLHERQAELEAHAARFEEAARELEQREQRVRDERASVERVLRRRTSELEAQEKELVSFERELQAREERLSAAEADLARRRSDVGAVELRRAALERREQALESRETAFAAREAALQRSTAAELLFVPGTTYRLLETTSKELAPGAAVDVEGEGYVVARIGRSPLPGDARRCAYLVRGAPRAEPGGSL